jgi:hypothetical protein
LIYPSDPSTSLVWTDNAHRCNWGFASGRPVRKSGALPKAELTFQCLIVGALFHHLHIEAFCHHLAVHWLASVEQDWKIEPAFLGRPLLAKQFVAVSVHSKWEPLARPKLKMNEQALALCVGYYQVNYLGGPISGNLGYLDPAAAHSKNLDNLD